MSAEKAPQSTPENPYFAIANGSLNAYMSALELAKQMQDKANLDPLTGVSNRYALEDSYAGLQDSFNRPDIGRRRTGEPEEVSPNNSFLMIDIDHFKAVNDNGGHNEGDRILRKVAGLIDSNTRDRDVVARIGGEEFVVLLPRATAKKAGLVAEKIRSAVEENSEVTVSIGVADANLGLTLEDNLTSADIALYEAKDQGRNRVVQFLDVIAGGGNGEQTQPQSEQPD